MKLRAWLPRKEGTASYYSPVHCPRAAQTACNEALRQSPTSYIRLCIYGSFRDQVLKKLFAMGKAGLGCEF